MFRTSQYPGLVDQQGSDYIYMLRTSQYPGWVDQKGSDCIYICLEPPSIQDGLTSRDQIVSEGDNIVLACKATGHPTPQIRYNYSTIFTNLVYISKLS